MKCINAIAGARVDSIAGRMTDLRDINIPVYILSTLEDHIAPWKATYAATLDNRAALC